MSQTFHYCQRPPVPLIIAARLSLNTCRSVEDYCVLTSVSVGRPSVFSFEVKFYPTEPSMLQEDLTRFSSLQTSFMFATATTTTTTN